MTTYGLDDRLKENHETLTNFWKNLTLQQLGISFGVVAFLIAVLGYFNQHLGLWNGVRWLTNLFGDFYANVSSELVSIVITVLILDRLNARRASQERKLGLFRQAKSRSNDVALEAVDQILHEGWWDEFLDSYRDNKGRADLRDIRWSGGVLLNDASLENANLKFAHLENAKMAFAHLGNADLTATHLNHANLVQAHLENADMSNIQLENAVLKSANMMGTYMVQANLKNTNLGSVNLENANLNEAHLERADLTAANLKNTNLGSAHLESAFIRRAYLGYANLVKAHLENADLSAANLKNANIGFARLENACLQSASLEGVKRIETAICNENTVLPDAEFIEFDNDGKPMYDKYWTQDTDMRRYTDPNHTDENGNPDFWEPNWVKREREEKEGLAG